jgi:hypothetical protein
MGIVLVLMMEAGLGDGAMRMRDMGWGSGAHA